MKTMKKRLLALLLIAAIMMSYAVCMADEQWFCPDCGNRNKKRFCTQCGSPSPEPGARVTPDTRWQCLLCGEMTDENYPRCGYCGAEKGAKPTPTPDNRWQCLICGNKTIADYSRCGYCGAEKGATPTPKLTATPTPKPTATPTPKPTPTPDTRWECLICGNKTIADYSRCGYCGAEKGAKPVKVGDIVKFGSYAGEKIEWRVLEVRSDSVLMISEYGLEAKAYNDVRTDVTWEKCTLRKWLNGDFYRNAFSTAERSMIVEVQNKNPDNSKYGTSGGNSTKDKVWLLSIDEAKKYFANDDARICYPTQHAKNNGAWTNGNGAGWWWLRSPGSYSYFAADVRSSGVVAPDGYDVRSVDEMARPVVVVALGFSTKS